MIVCVCNAVTEEEMRQAARAGSPDPAAAYARLGYDPVCCSCLPYAREIIEEERAKLLKLSARAA